jgi:hypothetical protein
MLRHHARNSFKHWFLASVLGVLFFATAAGSAQADTFYLRYNAGNAAGPPDFRYELNAQGSGTTRTDTVAVPAASSAYIRNPYASFFGPVQSSANMAAIGTWTASFFMYSDTTRTTGSAEIGEYTSGGTFTPWITTTNFGQSASLGTATPTTPVTFSFTDTVTHTLAAGSRLYVRVWFATTRNTGRNGLLDYDSAAKNSSITTPTFAPPPPPPGRGLLSYGSVTTGAIGQFFRTWAPSTFSARTAGPVSNITTNWTVLKASPVNVGVYAMAMATTEASNNLKIYSYNAGAWTSEFVVTQSAAQVNYRLFDVAFENTSGKVLVVYGKSTGGATQVFTREGTWNGTKFDWGAETPFTLNTSYLSGNVRWLALNNRINSDQMILTAVSDSASGNNITGAIWSGTAFGNQNTTGWGLVNDNTNWDFAGAYETATANGMVAWGITGSPYWKYARYVGSTWTVYNGTTTALTNNVRELALAADPRPTSNLIAVGLQETSTSNHANGAIWSGTAWTGQADVNTATNNVSYGRVINVAFAGTSGNAVLLWDGPTANTAGLGWALSQNGGAFAAQTVIALTGGNNEYNIQLVTDAVSNTIMYIRRDSNYDLFFYTFDGTTNTWTTATGAAIETDSSPNTNSAKESYMFAFENVYRIPTLGFILTFLVIAGFIFFAVRSGAIDLKRVKS